MTAGIEDGAPRDPQLAEGGEGESELMALLTEVSRQGAAVAPASGPAVQIEFGIAALEEVIADHGHEGEAHTADALAALATPSEATTAPAPVSADNDGGMAPATHGHLAIKIVFGEDEPGSGTTI